MMSNQHLRNKSLSCKAKGLLSMMLSYPEDWDYTLRGLTRCCRDGLDSIRNGINELEKTGYLIRGRKRNKNGQLGEAEYVIYEVPPAAGQEYPADTPQEQPPAALPESEKPVFPLPTSENPTQVNPTQLNTYRSNTYTPSTYSINPSLKKAGEPPFSEGYGWSEGLTAEELEQAVVEDLEKEHGIPVCYLADERSMTAAVHFLTEFDARVGQFNCHPVADSNDFQHSIFLLFNEALVQMLATQQPMHLRGCTVTAAKVLEKLNGYVRCQDYSATLGSLPETAMGSFEKACRACSIKNHLQYMKSCIWTAMQVGDIETQAALCRYHFGG